MCISPFLLCKITPEFTKVDTAREHTETVADPGFPVGGGVDLVGGGVDSRGGYVLKILYVKTKELGPLGGGARRARPPLDPPM